MSEKVQGFLSRARERRELGVTLGNCLRTARELHEDEQEVTAESIAYALIEENPQAFAKAGERDWESFFAAMIKFIEMIMPIIQMFMAFGV